MRPIDADALLDEKLFKNNRDTEYPDRGITSASVAIIDAPTIDAIPVEWIKQKQSEIPRSSSWYVMMQFLMDLWKEEQEGR